MRYALSIVLCLSLFFTAQLCQAEKLKLPAGDTQTALQDSEVKPGSEPKRPVAAPAALTQVRWTVQKDAAINDNRLRLVLELSAPVEADGVIANMPEPHLVITLKGAVPGGIENFLNLDGQFARSVSISADGQNTKLLIALSVLVENSDCRMFTLPSDVNTNKPFRVVVDISEPAPSPGYSFTPGLKDKVVVIDPGHGGGDHGAIGPGDTAEKTVTLAVALKTKALLEEAGAKVILTRQEDCNVAAPNSSTVNELKSRVVMADSSKADIFISIHANSSLNPLSHGTATYFYKKTSYDALLAQNIQNGIARAGGLRDRGFFPANFYVVKWTRMPAALVEMAFISNVNEEKLLNDPQFQHKMAQGIVEGLDRFFAQAAKRG